MDVATYIEEFHKLSLRSKIKEEESVKVARYLSGLKWSISKEMSLFTTTTILGCQHMAQNLEDKQRRKQEPNSKNRGRGRDSSGGQRGGSSRGGESRSQGERRLLEKSLEIGKRGTYGRGRGSQGNRGRGAGRCSSYFATMKCYQCGQLGHPTYRCPDKLLASNSEKRVAYTQEDSISPCTNEVSKLE